MPLTPAEEAELKQLEAMAPSPTAAATSVRRVPPKAPTPISSPQQDTFFRAIGATETGGSKNPYEAVGPKGSSASGKYQFLWNTWGPAINKFAGRPVTREQFLKDPQLQENWARHYYLREVTPQASHYWSKYKKTLKNAGVRNLEEVKAMIHFLGAGGVKQLATTGKYEVPGQNLTIPQYLGKFRTALIPPRKATPLTNKKRISVGQDLAEVPASELNRVLKDHPNAIILD